MILTALQFKFLNFESHQISLVTRASCAAILMHLNFELRFNLLISQVAIGHVVSFA
jgi:hypothetical protein